MMEAVDVAIVGAGLAGASVAHQYGLQEPEALALCFTFKTKKTD